MIYVLGVLDWFGNRYTDAVSEYTDVVVFNGFVQKIDTCRRIERFKMTYSSVPFASASISPVVACPSPFKTAGAPL